MLAKRGSVGKGSDVAWRNEKIKWGSAARRGTASKGGRGQVTFEGLSEGEKLKGCASVNLRCTAGLSQGRCGPAPYSAALARPWRVWTGERGWEEGGEEGNVGGGGFVPGGERGRGKDASAELARSRTCQS